MELTYGAKDGRKQCKTDIKYLLLDKWPKEKHISLWSSKYDGTPGYVHCYRLSPVLTYKFCSSVCLQ